MTAKQLAWGIAVWPFVLVLEMIAINYLVDYDWDMSFDAVLAVLGIWAAVALLIASLLWLPAGASLSRLLQSRSHTVQGIGFVALGFALGVVAAMIVAGVYANTMVNNNYVFRDGDFDALAVLLLQTTVIFVLPSLLGWVFATAMTAASSDRPRSSGRLMQQTSH